MASFKIKAKSNATSFARFMGDAGTQLAFANVLALTKTANVAKLAIYDEMRLKFDRPTTFALNSLYSTSATKSNPVAVVETRPGGGSVPAGRYLSPQEAGGQRRAKSHEVRLGEYAVPSKFAKLDAHGNLPGSVLKKMLSQLGIAADPSTNSTNSRRSKIKRKGDAFFRRGDIVFRREGRDIDPFLILLGNTPNDAPSYNRRFDFIGAAERAFDQSYGREFDKAFAFALATAK